MWNTTGPDSNRNAPPGVVPDYNHPEDVYWTLNVVIISICVVLITGFLAARVHVKRTINRKILTEDCESLAEINCGTFLTRFTDTCGIAYVRSSLDQTQNSGADGAQVLIMLYCVTVFMSMCKHPSRFPQC